MTEVERVLTLLVEKVKNCSDDGLQFITESARELVKSTMELGAERIESYTTLIMRFSEHISHLSSPRFRWHGQ
jgi:hypothetical protein